MPTNNNPHRKVVFLPQEVMDLIIDALALDSNPAEESRSAAGSHSDSSTVALARCLLVSSSFYAKARPLVFRSIVWREQVLPCDQWNDERDRRFFDLFRDHCDHNIMDIHNTPASGPGLFATPPVRLVRSLLLVVCFPKTARMVLFNGWNAPQSELNVRREIFPALLEQMVNIDEFGLVPGPRTSSSDTRGQGNTSTSADSTQAENRRILNWRTTLLWHESLKKGIKRVCRTARVLRFEDISHFPLSLLRACGNLRSLSLSSISSVFNDPPSTNDPQVLRPFTGLKKLEYLSTNKVHSDLFVRILEQRPKAFSSLKRLNITLPSESTRSQRYVRGERAVLQACGSSLKTLEIHSPTSQFSYPPNTISHFTSLHTLILRSTITTSLLPESFPPEMMTFFITDLVSSPSGSTSPSTLVELTLELHLDAPDLGMNAEDRVHIVPQEWERRWSRLDGILAGPAFPLLERLNVRFSERLKTIQEKYQEVDMVDVGLEEHDKINHHEETPAEIEDDFDDEASLKIVVDSDRIAGLEETSLGWLRGYIEGALPKVSASSGVDIKLEYRILAKDVPFPS